ncbi:hypothetical protein Esti_006027 [Eimeria stiedai]
MVFSTSVCMKKGACFRNSDEKAACRGALSAPPLLVEDDDPYTNSVRVLTDAIKRQAKRNVQAGHALVNAKAEEFEKHEKSHANNISAKLERLEYKLGEAIEKAETAEEQIDAERMRHAEAKQQIEHEAESKMLSLREQEDKMLAQQHRAEARIAEAEEQLAKEEAELRQARRHHRDILNLEQQSEQQAEALIEKERQEELADEEAAEAREESAEGRLATEFYRSSRSYF